MKKVVLLLGFILAVSLALMGCGKTITTDTRSPGTDTGGQQGTEPPSVTAFDLNVCIASKCAIAQGKYWYAECVATNCHTKKAKQTKNAADCDPIVELPFKSADDKVGSPLASYSVCVEEVAKAQEDSKVCESILKTFNEQFVWYTGCIRGVAVFLNDPAICQQITTAGLEELSGASGINVNTLVVEEWRNSCIGAVG